MKRHLLRKWIITSWIGILFILHPVTVIGNTIEQLSQDLGVVPGYATLTVMGGEYSDNDLVYITVDLKKGFYMDCGYAMLKLGNMSWPQPNSKNETATGYTYTFTTDAFGYAAAIRNGGTFETELKPSSVLNAEYLTNILNYYTTDCAERNENEVVLKKDVNPNIAISLDFTANNPILVQMGTYRIIKNIELNLNGGNLTFKVEEHTGYHLPNIEMISGSLTLDGENASLNSLVMKDGSLSLKNGAKINNLTANKGNITITNNTKDYSFKELSIEGDVTVTGDCVIKNEGTYREHDFLAEKISIKGGTVTMKQLRLSPNYPLIVEGGDVTFEEVACAQNFNENSSTFTKITSAIQQNGGNILLKNCYLNNIVRDDHNANYFIEMNAGSLVIDGGVFLKSGETGLLRITGETAHAEIKDGKFYANNNGNENYVAVYQENGTVDISGGRFLAPICIEGGALNLSKAHFPVVNTVWNNIAAHLHILGNEAKVSLSGGYYGGNAVYIDPSLSITPASLLADGYAFYTWDQGMQPDIEITDRYLNRTYNYNSVSYNYLDFGQVKRKDAIPVSNDCLEAAKIADVGPTGTDVKAIKVTDAQSHTAKYDLEINTAKGLAWLATKIYHDRYGITNGAEYTNINVACLTANLDMSAYNWIPFQFNGRKLDGQGHCVSGLKVNQSDAAFMSYNSDTLANLVVSGQFNSISTLYTNTSQNAAGLVIRNGGTIINCGVQQSKVSCVTTDILDAAVGGLVISNYGSIQNCYMTGNVTCNSTPVDELMPFGYKGNHKVGGLVGDNYRGSILNSYHADGVVTHTPASSTEILNITVEDIAVSSGSAVVENCTTNPDLEALNQKVKAHNTAVKIGEIAWSNWITTDGINNNYPIHEYKKDMDGPSSIEGKFTLLVEGNGEFKGTYYVATESPSPEPTTEEQTIVADTTITVINGKTFNLTATPGKGAKLEKVVRIKNSQETILDDIEESQSFTYNVVVSDSLKAYFHTDTLYIEKDTTVLGNTEEITEVKQISISDAGTKDKAAVIELGNVVVKSEDSQEKATTTIAENSHVILQLTGNNDLGKLINEGNTTLVFTDNQETIPSLTVTEVVNKGTFVDETGLIKTVQAENDNLLLGVNEIADKDIKVGTRTTLTAEAQVSDTYNVTFLWQKWNGTTWVDEQTNIETSQTPSIRTKAMLRASSPLKLANTLSVTLNTADTYQYRCLITNKVADVITTLTVKTEVKVTSASGDSDPSPAPDPVFYNVVLPSVTGVKTVPSAGTYQIEAGDYFTFNLTLEEAYNESHPVVTAGNKEITPAANGEYKINTVTGDVTISITGITLNVPTSNATTKEVVIKVWGHKNTLYILTPRETKAFIYTLGGQLYKTQTVSGEQSFPGMPSGSYLICIDEKVFKIAL